nr:hypothetical protein CFP56_63401 [Quercus suber]POE94755.1 hypothetical protein CFP56_16992 [Quercus suber]
MPEVATAGTGKPKIEALQRSTSPLKMSLSVGVIQVALYLFVVYFVVVPRLTEREAWCRSSPKLDSRLAVLTAYVPSRVVLFGLAIACSIFHCTRCTGSPDSLEFSHKALVVATPGTNHEASLTPTITTRTLHHPALRLECRERFGSRRAGKQLSEGHWTRSTSMSGRRSILLQQRDRLLGTSQQISPTFSLGPCPWNVQTIKYRRLPCAGLGCLVGRENLSQWMIVTQRPLNIPS